MNKCICCNNVFVAKKKDQKFCSRICCNRYWNANRPKKEVKIITVLCKHCGKSFKKRNVEKTLYCNSKCAGAYNRAIKKENKEKMITDKVNKTNWQEVQDTCKGLKLSYGEAVARGLI